MELIKVSTIALLYSCDSISPSLNLLIHVNDGDKIRRSAEAYIDENMPDVERPEPVRTVTMTVKTPVQKPVQNKPGVQKTPERKTSIKERLANAKIESVEYNTERRNPHKPKRNNDLDM